MSSKFIVFYETDDEKYNVIYSNDDKEVHLIEKLPDTKDYKQFFMLKSAGHKSTPDGLRLFYNDFVRWNTELKKNDVWDFDYSYYYNHNVAVMEFFKLLSKKIELQDIDVVESRWMEQSYNSGLMTCVEGQYKDAYAYDFSFNYPNILGSNDFKFPVKTGVEIKLKKIPDIITNIQYGFYRVKIQCDNPNFRKIFAFSKHNVYTHSSLRFARKHQHTFNVKIELICDGQPNLYSYKPASMITGDEIFGRWLKKLNELKELFPKNKLIKHLASTLWGNLSKKIIYHRTERQVIDDKLLDNNEFDIIDEKVDRKSGEHIYYELIKFSHLYATNYRLKPFLTAYSRNKIGDVILQDVDNCVRVQTDGVIMLKPLKEIPYLLKVDDKYSGDIKIVNVNKIIKGEEIVISETENYDINQ
jgi:hypothetical protein